MGEKVIEDRITNSGLLIPEFYDRIKDFDISALLAEGPPITFEGLTEVIYNSVPVLEEIVLRFMNLRRIIGEEIEESYNSGKDPQRLSYFSDDKSIQLRFTGSAPVVGVIPPYGERKGLHYRISSFSRDGVESLVYCVELWTTKWPEQGIPELIEVGDFGLALVVGANGKVMGLDSADKFFIQYHPFRWEPSFEPFTVDSSRIPFLSACYSRVGYSIGSEERTLKEVDSERRRWVGLEGGAVSDEGDISPLTVFAVREVVANVINASKIVLEAVENKFEANE